MDTKDVEDTRSLTRLRSHVERITGVVRNQNKILSSEIPVEMVLPCPSVVLINLVKLTSQTIVTND